MHPGRADLQVRHNKALLTYLITASRPQPAGKHSNAPAATALATALAQLLPHGGAWSQLVAASAEALSPSGSTRASPKPPPAPLPPPPACVPAQLNLAALLLAHGFPAAALRLVAPVVAGTQGQPGGTAARAFVTAAEAHLALGSYEVSHLRMLCCCMPSGAVCRPRGGTELWLCIKRQTCRCQAIFEWPNAMRRQ
jgi:Copper binding octapeptide repeat